jgi:hypothetical protein
MRVIADKFMLEGYQALMRNGQVVWVGKIGMPIEDVEFDTLILHPNDYERLSRTLMLSTC